MLSLLVLLAATPSTSTSVERLANTRGDILYHQNYVVVKDNKAVEKNTRGDTLYNKPSVKMVEKKK